MSKRKENPQIVPRRAPATNLRKAGANEDKKRKAVETIDENEDDLLVLGSWAFDEE